MLGMEDVTPRIACFLSQQAAEKALKAGLISTNQQFPKIHGLTRLLASYPDAARPGLDEDDLDTLDPWVVNGRYAADLPAVDSAEATVMVAIATQVVEAVGLLVDHGPATTNQARDGRRSS